MKSTYLLLFLSLTSRFGLSQQHYTVTYDQLKEFEGLYEYINNTTLKMAASPADTLLYAIIDKARYPLMPVDKDQFHNRQKDKIVFFRNKAKTIAGYVIYNDTLKLLSKNVSFPRGDVVSKSCVGQQVHL